jgi:lipopolysaccharide/colanic/teichoic acid biosynthesis glycosyltransferase
MLNSFVKRILDVTLAIVGLIVLSFPLGIVLILIWKQDFKSPFYVSNRVGRGGNLFRIVKLRTMVVNADKNGIDSTSINDTRITPIGHFIRAYKLDEITQLWNVLVGDMSLVGPRPNVKSETDLYTSLERKLLKLKPGITDFASIVFSDEGEILAGKSNTDIAYNQLIRPRKSELGLFYVDNNNIFVDIVIILITIFSVFSRTFALKLNSRLLMLLNASEELIITAQRQKRLFPKPPPGSNKIVKSRNI